MPANSISFKPASIYIKKIHIAFKIYREKKKGKGREKREKRKERSKLTCSPIGSLIHGHTDRTISK